MARRNSKGMPHRDFAMVWQTAYCTLGIVALCAALGLFNYSFQSDFHLYFTGLSNLYCLLIMFVELICTLRNRLEPPLPVWKFIGMCMIAFTGIVFNLVLAEGRNMQDLFSISSLLMHNVLPVMFLLDGFIFYRSRKAGPAEPLLALMPLVLYLAFIFIRANKFTGIADVKLYPYFFLDPAKVKWAGVRKWSVLLCAGYLILGYILMLISRIPGGTKPGKKKTTSRTKSAATKSNTKKQEPVIEASEIDSEEPNSEEIEE